MFIRKLLDCDEFIAGDNTILREILHPDKQKIDLRYSFAHAVVKPGLTTYLHSLKTSEIYYILEGSGEMLIDDEKAILNIGDTVYIPSNAKQCITNIGDDDLKFICIVDPAWRKEDETVFLESN
jgi:mannose-6-phosphate isomerase-like protein (cupin superfamily)